MPALYDAKPIAVRLRQRDRELLQQAAEVAGEHPSAFARRAAVERARCVLREAEETDSVLTGGRQIL